MMRGPFTNCYWRDWLVLHVGIFGLLPVEVAYTLNQALSPIVATIAFAPGLIGGLINYLIDREFE